MNTKNYDKHDEHAAWVATRRIHRAAFRAEIARGFLHLIFSFGLGAAVIWTTVDYFRAFGWAGALPTAISGLIWAVFAAGDFSPLTGVEFCLATLPLFYLYTRQKYSWTVAGLMAQNRAYAKLVREEIGEKEGGDL